MMDRTNNRKRKYLFFLLIVLLSMTASGYAQDLKKDLKNGNRAFDRLDSETAKKFYESAAANPKVDMLGIWDQIGLFRNLGWIYFTDKQFSDATTTYTRALRAFDQGVATSRIPKSYLSRGDHVDDYFFLGAAEVEVGKYSDAEGHLLLGLKLGQESEFPSGVDYHRIQRSLGILYYRSKDFARAEQYLSAFVESTNGQIHYQNSETITILANIYREEGRYASAEDLYEKAIKMMEWYDVHGSPHGYDDVRISNFTEYAKLLRLLKRDNEALALDEKVKAIQKNK